MNINIKEFGIDFDRSKTQVIDGSLQSANIVLYRGTEYVLRANVYSNSASTVVQAFANTVGWELDIGRLYGSNASPVIIEANTASWNNTSDWTLTDVTEGRICCRVNTSGDLVSSDLGNASSDTYTMEIWYTNNVGAKALVVSDACSIHNATII